MSISQHWGFNLEASIQGDPSNLLVKGHKLDIKVRHDIILQNEYSWFRFTTQHAIILDYPKES